MPFKKPKIFNIMYLRYPICALFAFRSGTHMPHLGRKYPQRQALKMNLQVRFCFCQGRYALPQTLNFSAPSKKPKRANLVRTVRQRKTVSI